MSPFAPYQAARARWFSVMCERMSVLTAPLSMDERGVSFLKRSSSKT